VIGEFSEGYELLEIPGDIRADIVVADFNFPTVNNTDLLTLLHQWNPAQKMLILSDNLSPQLAIRALRNGALGYILGLDEFETLVQAILVVHTGQRFVSRFVTDQMLDALVAGKNFENGIDERISTREREILQLIAEGKTNSEIGKKLVISTRTVETHRNNLMRKLGFSSQIDIIRYAFKNGLLSID
jgi:DNA-binding NarL/FixJ family response regulator